MNGDLLDEQTLRDLAENGLVEIHFSVKLRDFDRNQEHVYAITEKAVATLPDAIIEMPVIPESLDEMTALMVRASAIGVRCINLLELCFPLHNAEEFRKRNLELRKRPYAYAYKHWYSGGVLIARSVHEALVLLEFASNK